MTNNNSQQMRLNTLIDLCKKTNLEPNITSQTKIKGTTLEKLSQFDSGGYKRVFDWLTKTLEQQKPKLSGDMADAKIQLQKCFELMQSRNASYGNSWKVLSVQSIANLIEMKMNRVAQLGEIDAKSLDEFQDCLNYACFALIKLSRKV